MGFFKHVEGEAAIIIENGVYKQVDLYTRDGTLYAKTGGGFIKLMADGSTTKAKVRLEHLSFEGTLFRDRMGRLVAEDRPGAIPLEEKRQQMLLGAPGDDR